jgi:hypothetical protein
MRFYVSVGALYDIKMRASVCLKALYIILSKWESVYAECTLHNIIEMIVCMFLNALHMILLKWDLVCL